MASSTLRVLSLTPPTPTNRSLIISFLPQTTSEGPNPIVNPSTSLSLEFRNGGKEVFVDRITKRELNYQEDGSFMVTVPKVPVFEKDDNGNDRVTQIRVYAWKGEKMLGEWDVGSY